MNVDILVYELTIQALKDFTAAKERLDRAEKDWDSVRNRYMIYPPVNDFLMISPEDLGRHAQKFYSAKRAYDRLGTAAGAVIRQSVESGDQR